MTVCRQPCGWQSIFEGAGEFKMNLLKKVGDFCRNAGNKAQLAVIGAVGTVASGSASAQATYDTLTGAVDWSDVGAAILTVFAAIVGVLVIFKGGKMVLKAVRGA